MTAAQEEAFQECLLIEQSLDAQAKELYKEIDELERKLELLYVDLDERIDNQTEEFQIKWERRQVSNF